MAKTKHASDVLKLMDEDVSYTDAVKRIIKQGKISREKLEKDLDLYI